MENENTVALVLLEVSRREIAQLKAENEKLKSAFDDRCKVIEMQLKDKQQLKQLVEELRDYIENGHVLTFKESAKTLLLNKAKELIK